MRDYEVVRGFIESPRFYKRWIALGFSEEDLLELQLVLISDPKIGPVMRGTGRLRKMRYAFEDRGKSGSDEKENLTKDERNKVKKALSKLETELFGDKK